MRNHTKQLMLIVITTFMLMIAACRGSSAPAADGGYTATPPTKEVPEDSGATPSIGEEVTDDSDGEAETSTAEALDVPEVELHLWVSESDFHETIQRQIERFIEETGIVVVINALPDSDYNAQLLKATLSGEPIDVMEIHERQGIAVLLPHLLPMNELMDDDDFLPGAKVSGSIGEKRYGLAWQRMLCTSSYTHLAIHNRSQMSDESLKLINFLVESEQQIENFEEANWYPTRSSVNQELTQCGEEASRFFDISVPLNEVDAPEMEARYPRLEENLRAMDIMQNESPFALPQAVALLDTALKGRTPFEEGRVFAGAIPVERLPVEKFVDQLPEGVLLGGLLLDRFESQLIPPGDYGVRWQADDPNDVETFRFILIDENGEEQALDPELYTFGNVNGAISDAERMVSFDEPIARFAKGSSESCWYWWVVCGCMRTGG